MEKKSGQDTKQRGLIVNARNRKTLSLTDVEKAANNAKRTHANDAVIIVGEETEIPEDVRNFAEQQHVQITAMDENRRSLSEFN